ncbi:MAG: hypothetical protein ACOC7M_00465 [Chloroflexota bacterium]
MAMDYREVAKYLTGAMIPVLDLDEDADEAAVQVAHLYWTMYQYLNTLHEHEAVPVHMPKVKASHTGGRVS